MKVRRKARQILRMIKNKIIIQEEESRPGGKERKTVYNPYKKRYEIRQPSRRKEKKDELKMVLSYNENERDALWIGDRMLEEKNDGDMRLWLQNWNGIEKYDVDIMTYQLSVLVDNKIDYFSIVESQFNQYYKQTVKKWDKARDQIIPNGTISHTSTPGFPLKSPYQPGGVMSGFWGKLAQRHQKTIRDQYGRWHVDQFYGKEKCLKIYTLYRVNPSSGEELGDTKAWTQQRTALQDNNDERDPRQAVVEDIIKELEKDISEKTSIIIMADLNETVNGPEKTNNLFQELGLINVMQEYLGERAMPRTCERGSQAIDHIWTTSNVYSQITQAGYAPFHFIKHSDHRGLFIDLKLRTILDNDTFHLQHIRKKRLRCSIPSRVKKYMENLQSKWELNNIEERFTKIQEAFDTNGANADNVETLNNLDQQITEIMIQSERKCSYVPSHSVGRWSTKLRDAIKKLITAATKRTKAKYVKVGMNIDEAKVHFKQMDSEWKEAKIELKEVRAKAKQLRESHIEECAQRNVEKNENKVLCSEIKRLKTIEAQREQADRLQYVMKPLHKVGVNTIMIPAITTYSIEERNEEGFDHYDVDRMWQKIIPYNGKDIIDWERITNKDDVQKLLLNWQRKHFTQACECPLGSTEWNDRLREPQTQESILNGTFRVENLPVEVQEIFDQMKRHENVQEEISYTSEIDDFISFIKGASEKTSTSPSGRGYNHYKVLVMEEAWDELHVIHGILELARKHGIILNRWKKTVTTLMEKDAGRPKIHRMRAIHIIEAEVQFLTKLFYCKKLMHKAEAMNAITDQQYGGRKNKMAQSAVINKLMYYGIVHQQLMQAAFMDDDARNCYDRIITALSAIELRAWGQSYAEAEFSIEFLQQQEYHLRTSHGITKDYYKYSRDDPTHGSGQGIGWAGVKFTKTSDTISRAMEKNCAGMLFQDPEKQISVRKNGDMFVDDAAIGVTENVKVCSTVLEQLEHDQQKHGYYMFAEGHKLAFDKCYYYLIDFVRDGYSHRHKLVHELDGELALKEGFDTQYKPIKRLQPFACHRTLGIHIAADGNQKGQIRVLESKIKEWCKKLKTRYLNGSDTLYAYNAYLLAGLRYILCATSLSYKECDRLGKLIEPILFNAYSIQKNCARTILYASKKMGGFGIYHLYHVQAFEKLKFLFHHTRTNDQTGKLLTISRKWTQLEVGTSAPFTYHDYTKMKKFVTATWLTHLWEYMTVCNIRKKFLDDDECKTGKRVNDFYLMDEIHSANIPLEQKLAFNQVRLYMKVETASDIIVINSGTTICDGIKQCENRRESKKGWPNIKDIPDSWKDIWKSLLEQIIEPKLQNRRLGKWIQMSHQEWNAKMTENGSIIQIGEVQYTYWKKNVYRQSELIRRVQLPISVDIKYVKQGIKLMGQGIVPVTNISLENESVEAWKIRNWGTLTVTNQVIEDIFHHMKTDNLVLASDGSVLSNGTAAHAFCIACADTNLIIARGTAPVDGDRDRMNSYRAECFGALAAINLVEHVKQIKKYKGDLYIPMYIDNSETIRTINGKKNVLSIGNAFDDNSDIAIELFTTAKESNVLYDPIHVKGHSDEINDELTFPQELNCEMDAAVGIFVRSPPPRLLPLEYSPLLPKQKVCIMHLERPLVMDTRDIIILSMMQDEIVKYFTKRHNVKETYIHELDLEIMEKVLNSSKSELGKKVKNINYEWHTMEVSKRWGKTKSALCPICHQENETWKHVYRCHCKDMQRCKREQIEKIRKQLEKLKTLPQLQQHFLTVLKNDEKILSVEPFTESRYKIQLEEAHQLQQKIGYQAFLKGFLCKKWYQIQDQYYRSHRVGNQYNIYRWRKEVVRIIINFGNELWNERCTIVNAEKNATDEQLFRVRMYELSLQMKQNKDKFHPRDHHLLQRNRKYFYRTDRINIEMWQIRLQAALASEINRRENSKDSIEPYLIRNKVRRRKRRLQENPRQQRIYRQQLLVQQVTSTSTCVNQSTISDEQTLLDSEIKRKRRKLENLVKKRLKRKRQVSITSFPARTSNKNPAKNKRFEGNTQHRKVFPSAAPIPKRLKRLRKKWTIVNTQQDPRKKQKTTASRRENGGSVREQIRALTGQDIKNNR